MQDWIFLARPQAAEAQKQKIRGVDMTVYMSPHNVPRAVRGEKVAESGVFRIEFQYLDGSEHLFGAPRVSKDGIVSIYPGRQSGRIERIDVDVSGLQPETVSLNISVFHEVEKSLRELQGTEPTLSKRMNYDAARNALEESGTLMHAL